MMSKEPNFFEAVASHNLERFHSECIAWVLNTIKNKKHKIFDRFKDDEGDDFKFVKAVAEVQQHDIVLLYQNQTSHKYKYVFVENKTKSTLSRKYLKNTKDDIPLKFSKVEGYDEKFAKNLIVNGMLQSSYYQLRWLTDKYSSTYRAGLLDSFEDNDNWNAKENGKNKEERSKIVFNNFVSPEWVIISQMDEDTFKGIYNEEYNLNNNFQKLGVKLKGEGNIKDWKYLTYENLFKDLDLGVNEDNILKEYVAHAKGLVDCKLDLGVAISNGMPQHKDSFIIGKGTSNNPYPITQFVLDSFKDENKLFKFSDGKKTQLQENIKILEKVFDIEVFKLNDVEDWLKEIWFGIQLEDNNLKFYFRHSLYYYVESLKEDKLKYIDLCNSKLNLNSDFFNNKNEVKSLKKEMLQEMNHKLSFEFEKVNFPTTKSFYSFSKRLEGDDFGEKELWFDKKLNEKDKEFKERIEALSKLIVGEMNLIIDGVEKLNIKNN